MYQDRRTGCEGDKPGTWSGRREGRLAAVDVEAARVTKELVVFDGKAAEHRERARVKLRMTSDDIGNTKR